MSNELPKTNQVMETARRPIRGIGEICHSIQDDLFEARMRNGYEVLAYLDLSLKGRPLVLGEGSLVEMEFSAYDMSKGRILGVVEENV